MDEKRTHAERLDRLYRLIVLSAQARDNLRAAFVVMRKTCLNLDVLTGTEAAQKEAEERAAYNAYNRYINDMIWLYRKAGGRRSLSQYVKEDI